MSTEHDDPRDELASAYLDGVATPDEVEAARADPHVLARAHQFDAARDVLRRDTPLPDPAERDAVIASVLARAATTVASLDERRGARADRLRTVALAAVAAVLVFGAITGAVALSGRTHDESTAASSAAAPTAAAGTAGAQSKSAADTGAGSTAQQSSESSTARPPSAPNPNANADATLSASLDLGTFTSTAALRDALASRLPRASASTPAGGTEATGAAVPAPDSCPSVGTPRFVARLDGRPVLVTVRANEATVYDAATCTIVAMLTL
jgi:hypothetical protein